MGGQLFSQKADGDVPFSDDRSRLFFLERGIKRKQFFWSRLNNVIPMTTGSKFHSYESLGTTAGQRGTAGAVRQA